jgi:C4-dicarboxylate-specific signal transduction histidine kinase
MAIFWLIPLSSWLMLRHQRDPLANLWFTGTALYSVVVTLFVLGSGLPQLVRGPVTSGLAFMSVLCMFESMRRELSQRPAPLHIYAMVLVTVFVLPSLLLWFDVNPDLRRALSLGFIAAAEVALIVVTDRVRRHHNSRALWLVNAMFGAFVLSNISRILEWMWTGSYSVLLDFTALSNVGLVVNYLSAIFYCYGYWGFVVEKKQQQLVRATEAAVTARENEKHAIERAQMAQKMMHERTELMGRLAIVGKHAQSGALTASIAHELNQPLAAIRLNVEEALRMSRECAIPSTLMTVLGRIELDNRRSSAFVLRLRQMFTQRLPKMEELILDDVVRYVVEWMKPRLKSEGVTVQLNLDTATPLRFAGGEIEHILLNLMDNAIDAMQQPGQGPKCIAIRTWREVDRAFMAITDSGPGVPLEFQKKVFELSETGKSNGMGVGLCLSRYIIERHGGSIRLAAPTELSGACFLLELPNP